MISADPTFYLAKGSNLADDYLFGLPKQQSWIRRFHGNEEVEITVREWMRMQQPEICRDKIYKTRDKMR